MKKLLTSVTMALTLCGLSAFGQGYFLFDGDPGSVWSSAALTGTTARRGPAIYDVAFLWGTGTPQVVTDTGLNGVPTNYAGPYIIPPWNDILNDPNFQLAVNANGGTNVVAPTGANGNFSYNGGATFPVAGTSSGGGVVQEYVIAWLSVYSTPQAAAAAGSIVGWSAPFNYLYTSSIGTPLLIANSGFRPFSFPTPEPSTLALAGLGGLSLLLFRRRKQDQRNFI